MVDEETPIELRSRFSFVVGTVMLVFGLAVAVAELTPLSFVQAISLGVLAGGALLFFGFTRLVARYPD